MEKRLKMLGVSKARLMFIDAKTIPGVILAVALPPIILLTNTAIPVQTKDYQKLLTLLM